MFTASSIVRSCSDPLCAGEITVRPTIMGEQFFYEVLLADGSGKRMLSDALLDAWTAAPDSRGDWVVDRFADSSVLRRTSLHHRLTDRLS